MEKLCRALEDRLVLEIAKWLVSKNASCETTTFPFQDGLDWARFKYLVSYHGLYPSVYPFFDKHNYILLDIEKEIFRHTYYRCLANQTYLWHEFVKISDMFNNKGIILAPIKGAAFMADNIYQDKAFLRPMCDIDILIKKEELNHAEGIMLGMGYQKNLCGMKEKYWKDENYHIAFTKRINKMLNYYAEVHWALDYKRDKPILPNLWGRIKKCATEGREISLLSPEDTLFVLALHQRRFGPVLCLKNACDAVMLLNRYNKELDWGYVLNEANSADMRVTLYFLLAQVKILFGKEPLNNLIEALDVSRYEAASIEKFIVENIFLHDFWPPKKKQHLNILFLKSHFLLYDNFWEPVKNILCIPLEQFAKFYKMEPYSLLTRFLYNIRYIYFLASLFGIALKPIFSRLKMRIS